MTCRKINVKILDGGFSTEVLKNLTDDAYASKLRDDPLWTARLLKTDPEAVVKTHLAFLRAGSEYISTNTYQASIEGFKKHLNLNDAEARELIRTAYYLAERAVKIYKEECSDKNPIIVGSIGPYGAALHDASEYTGNYSDSISIEELQNWHRPRITELANCDIKYFAFETLPCQKEAEALAGLLKEFPQTKAWISFSCKDDQNLANGENFQAAGRKCYDINPQQIIAIGLNCLKPRLVESLFNGINDDRLDSPMPLIVYPNRGETFINFEWVSSEEYRPIQDFVETWIKLGVRYIGGCCRIDADEIKKIGKVISSCNSK